MQKVMAKASHLEIVLEEVLEAPDENEMQKVQEDLIMMLTTKEEEVKTARAEVEKLAHEKEGAEARLKESETGKKELQEELESWKEIVRDAKETNEKLKAELEKEKQRKCSIL
jgi:hypothetical protein